MPIMKELNNVKRFKSVGFTAEQAETLADAIEQSHVDSQQDLKEFISSKLADVELQLKTSQAELETRMTTAMAELKTSQAEMEARLKASQLDLLIKYSAIMAGFISIALAIIKLF